jgi:hypothetical protein
MFHPPDAGDKSRRSTMRAISVHVHTDTVFVNRPFDAYRVFHNGQQVHPNEYWFKDLEGIRVFLQKMGIPVSVIFNGMGILNRSFDRDRS